jgi:type IV pilus assembly protein PilO
MALNSTKINLSDVNWDFNEAGNWPLQIKAGVIAVVCVAMIGAGIYYDTMPQLQALDVLQKKETELKTTFEFKSGQASNLTEYQEQLSQIQEKLQAVIDQMPLVEEVAALLIDISQTGLSSGLEFKLFKPAPPINKDFYSELPINIEVVGRYDQLLTFISGLASLPRIVTTHDLTISPIDKTKISKQNPLFMSVLVKTYHENSKNNAKK